MDPLRIRQEIKRTTMLAAQVSRETHTHGFTIQRKCNMETKKTGGGWSTQEHGEDSAKPVDGDRSQ
jgi:hypothetical protein